MKKIYEKISKLQREIGSIKKNDTNPHFNSSYFDINTLLEHLEPLLEKNKLLLLQPIMDGKVITQIIDLESLEEIRAEIQLPDESNPQKIGSSISYYRRYGITSLISIQAEDDDGNHGSGKAPTEAKEKAWLNENTPEWKEALTFIAGGGTVAQIKKKYKISKTSEEKLK